MPVGQVTVVNLHHLPNKQLPDESYVYIGRPRRGGSLGLGNPIALADHNNDRAAVLTAYREYAQAAWRDPANPMREQVIALAKRVLNGEDLKLVCWCAPKACHGDVLKEAIENLVQRALKPASAETPPSSRSVRP